MPKLFGRSYPTARKRLKAAACPLVTITKPGGKTPKGKKLVVRKVSPKAGTALKATQALSVTLGFVKK